MRAASAQTITIVQGQGQLVCDLCAGVPFSFPDDLVVLVTDANGNPVSNAAVSWTVVAADHIAPPNGQLIFGPSTVTGSSTSPGAGLCTQLGYSCQRYTGTDTGGKTLRVMSITATSSGKSITFTLTEAPSLSPSDITNQNVLASVTDPPANTLFTGTAGTTDSSGPAIQATVFTAAGTPVANVSVRLVPDAGSTPGAATATCASQTGADPGSVLTSSSGIATCNVVFGQVPSTGTPPQPSYVRILIGGVVTPLFQQNVINSAVLGLELSGETSGPIGFGAPFNARYEVIVTPATPAAVQIISGNNQTANRGQAFASPLVVKVVDASSPPNPLPSASVLWSVVPNGAAFVTPASPTTDSNGEVSATVALSTATAGGPLSVTATTANGKSATFNLSVNVAVTGLTISSGDMQSVSEGQQFQAVAVQVVTSTGQSAVDIPVQFAVISGPATVSASSNTTDQNGIAGVGLVAGNTTGPVIVTATVGAFSVSFHLTVLPPGLTLTSANFLNGAGFFATGNKNSGALSPCSIGTVVIGTPLTTATLPSVPNLFGAAIQQPSGASVIFNPTNTNPVTGDSAPILGAFGNSAQTLITFQVPCDVTPGGAVPVSVTLNNATTLTPVNLDIRSASPGIFELPMSDGIRRAVAVRPDGTFVSLTNPARRTETIRIYITGIGPVVPALATNALPTPGVDSLSTAAFLAVQIATPVTAANPLGLELVPVLPTSRVSPALLGVFELDIAIPADATQGNNTFLEVAVLVTNPGDYQDANPGVGSKLPIQ